MIRQADSEKAKAALEKAKLEKKLRDAEKNMLLYKEKYLHYMEKLYSSELSFLSGRGSSRPGRAGFLSLKTRCEAEYQFLVDSEYQFL